MTVYVDPLIRHGSGLWCHMATDGPAEELHEMAERIGLRRQWFQAHPRMDHYDLRASVRKKALAAGAVEIKATVMLKRCGKAERGDRE